MRKQVLTLFCSLTPILALVLGAAVEVDDLDAVVLAGKVPNVLELVAQGYGTNLTLPFCHSACLRRFQLGLSLGW